MQQSSLKGSVTGTFLAPAWSDNDKMRMRQILETEDHVAVPPMMYSDPFYRITYLIKEEIRKHKWLEGEKGRQLSWEDARAEWTEAHRKEYEKFLLDTLSFPNLVPAAEQKQARLGAGACSEERDVSMLPHRSGGHILRLCETVFSHAPFHKRCNPG